MFSLNQKVMQRDVECLSEVLLGCHSRMVNEPQLSGRCWWHKGEDSRDRWTLTVVTVARARGRSSACARARKAKGTVALQPEAQIRGSYNSLIGYGFILGPLQVASMKTDLIAKNNFSRLTVGKVYKYSGFGLNLTKDRNWADFCCQSKTVSPCWRNWMMFTALEGFAYWLSPTAQHSAEKWASTDLQNELPSASLGCQGFKLLFEMLWFGVYSSSL